MNRKWMFVLALSVGLNAGLIYREVSESRRRPPEREKPTADRIIERRLAQLTGRLTLDLDQQARVRAVLEEYVPQVMAHGDSVEQVRSRLAAAYGDSVVDAGRVRALRARMNRVQAEADSLMSESLLREAELLTPAQRVDYAKILPWRRHGHGRR